MKHLLLLPLVLCFLNSFSQSDFNETKDIKWEFKTKASVFSSPVIKEEVVYCGGLDSILYAIDLKTGEERWRFKTMGEIRSDVCIAGDDLYLNGGDGNMYALDVHSGKEKWVFKTKGEQKYDFADYFNSTPVFLNGMLYVGSGDGNIYAINAKSGMLIWSFKTGGIVHTKPALDNNKIFLGSFDGYVYALNMTDGSLVWKFKTVGHSYFPKGEVEGSPTVFKNMVFIGARDYNFYALDQNTGTCLWNKAYLNGWALNSSVHDSVLYMGSADERKLISANPLTGTENWNLKMEYLIFGNNAYSDSVLYVGTTIGKLHEINIKTGLKTGSFETESYKKSHLKYFKMDDSYRDDIYDIIKSNEQLVDVECELGGIFSSPSVSGDLILFSSTNGIIYCLKRELFSKKK